MEQNPKLFSGMAQLLIVEEFTKRVLNSYRFVTSLIGYTHAPWTGTKMFRFYQLFEVRIFVLFFSWFVLYLTFSRSIALRHDFSLFGCISTYSRARRGYQKHSIKAYDAQVILCLSFFFFRWKVSFNISLRWAIKKTQFVTNDLPWHLTILILFGKRLEQVILLTRFNNESTRTI